MSTEIITLILSLIIAVAASVLDVFEDFLEDGGSLE